MLHTANDNHTPPRSGSERLRWYLAGATLAAHRCRQAVAANPHAANSLRAAAAQYEATAQRYLAALDAVERREAIMGRASA